MTRTSLSLALLLVLGLMALPPRGAQACPM